MLLSEVEQRNLTAGQLVSVYEKMLSIEDKQRLEQEAKENLKTNLENRNRAVPTAPGSEGMSREVAQRIGFFVNHWRHFGAFDLPPPTSYLHHPGSPSFPARTPPNGVFSKLNILLFVATSFITIGVRFSNQCVGGPL